MPRDWKGPRSLHKPGPSLPRPSGMPLPALRMQGPVSQALGRGCPDGSFCPPGKIDIVKSKWGLALAAVVAVLSSLLMSVGLCTLFGLTPTLNGFG